MATDPCIVYRNISSTAFQECHFYYVFADEGYGRGGTPVFIGVFEPLARVTLYLTDENG